MDEFMLPEFLQTTEEETHQMMIEMAPPDYDTAEGALYWDHTRPTARVKDRLVSYELTFSLMMKFPQFASGPFLDLHGEPIGVDRHPAVHANVGGVTFVGSIGTIIPLGTVVATIGDENEASHLYEVTESGTITSEVGVTLRIKAVEAGVIGNIPAGAISGVTKPINGLTSITNPLPIEGGIDKEEDESYRIRILEKNRNKPLSGAKRDYVRWAKEVPGVGDVIVLPLWNGPKTVKVLITNSTRQIAPAELIAAVKEHIDPIDGMGEGTAPIGAVVTIGTITLIPMSIVLSLTLEPAYLLADVLQDIKKNVNALLSEKSLVKYTDVFTTITDTAGVADHSGLLLNGSTQNIALGIGERSVVGEVTPV